MQGHAGENVVGSVKKYASETTTEPSRAAWKRSNKKICGDCAHFSSDDCV